VDDGVVQRRFNIDHIVTWATRAEYPYQTEVLTSCGLLYTVRHTEAQVTTFIKAAVHGKPGHGFVEKYKQATQAIGADTAENKETV
jgi:hypothetical protein